MCNGLKIAYPFSCQSAALSRRKAKELFTPLAKHCPNALGRAFPDGDFIIPSKVAENVSIKHPLKLVGMIVLADRVISNGRSMNF